LRGEQSMDQSNWPRSHLAHGVQLDAVGALLFGPRLRRLETYAAISRARNRFGGRLLGHDGLHGRNLSAAPDDRRGRAVRKLVFNDDWRLAACRLFRGCWDRQLWLVGTEAPSRARGG